MQLLLRGAGAFFIRRDNQARADAAAYRRVFAGAQLLSPAHADAPLSGQSPNSQNERRTQGSQLTSL